MKSTYDPIYDEIYDISGNTNLTVRKRISKLEAMFYSIPCELRDELQRGAHIDSARMKLYEYRLREVSREITRLRERVHP